MTNRQILVAPFLKHIVGADSFIGAAERLIAQASETAFPPYNIIKAGENQYRIELAVAGFALEDLTLETKEKTLLVAGEAKETSEEGATFLHRGIAARRFKREFQLAEYVEVKGASLRNGILSIVLVREVPEAQKHRKIDIAVARAEASAEVEAPVAAE
jgi:molecular chaperone IbpA|nr:Hsp20 family protein [Neorhizobium tomejilense]